jgi:hypothetical protein
VSDVKRANRAVLPDCPRCKAAQMIKIVSIAPIVHGPGLIAYECRKCGYVTSVTGEVLPRRSYPRNRRILRE